MTSRPVIEMMSFERTEVRIFLMKCLLLFRVIECQSTPPVVIIPGYQSSNLEMHLDINEADPEVVQRCPMFSENAFEPMWLNEQLLSPFTIDCLEYGLRLRYDNLTRRTINSPGVTIRPLSEFGSTEPIEFLTYPSRIVPLFSIIINYLTDNYGYIRGKDVRGAPYDWRKSPNENKQFLKNLKRLIEHTFYINGQEKVVLLTHSMGGMYATYFLNQQSQKWKDKYIRRLILMGTPLGGSVDPLIALTQGGEPVSMAIPFWGSYFMSDLVSMPFQQTTCTIDGLTKEAETNLIPFPNIFSVLKRLEPDFTSSSYLMPNHYGFRSQDVLIETPNMDITVDNLVDFLASVNRGVLPNLREVIEDMTPTLDFDHPGVAVTCFYTVGRQSLRKIKFLRLEDIPNNPTRVCGDGDGVVPLPSLEYCKEWGLNTDYDFDLHVEVGDHMSTLYNHPETVWRMISK